MKPAFFQITLKIFVCSGSQLLVLRDQKSGTGDLPGGRFGPGEIYEPWPDSARRELAEELGDEFAWHIELDAEPIFYFPHFIQESQCEGLGIAYRGRYQTQDTDNPPLPRLSDEHDAARWVPLADYDPATDFVDHLKEAVRRFQQMIK